MSDSIIYVGMDVHKDFVMMAVLPADAARPTRVERVPNEPTHLRRFFRRWLPQGRVRACYEASGAGYVLQRTLEGWGVECAVIAPALMPTRPGHQRKHDKRDASDLADRFRFVEPFRSHVDAREVDPVEHQGERSERPPGRGTRR